MFIKKVAICDIAKMEKSQILDLFENETSFEYFFLPTSFKSYC